jgi:hypothetical protein
MPLANLEKPPVPPSGTVPIRAAAVISGSRHRRWAALLALAASLAMAPWTVGLATRLPHRYVATHWNLTWLGFDALLLVSFAVTAWATWRRGRPAVAATAVTITLLGCDAWFDLTTASTMSDAVTSAVIALAGELPLAALLGVLVLRAHRTATTR